ncbi:hypothetical protein DPMN_194503 [Dreissena polymorpha]|uniref:Uncharacterized protein n=1 Tax=Dreissena polymorpha TaxID=45954 RepID=A0A9D3Y3X6_DREPO|nr:hypothetical protein DPMN_194503 [Dreissena polymorpha]
MKNDKSPGSDGLSTCVARWATHPLNSIARLGAVVSGESVAEGTLTDPDETWQTCVALCAKHPPSSSARLSAVVCGESVAEGTLTDPYLPSTKLGGLVWPGGARLGAVVSGESVAEGTLTGPYWPRYRILGT